MFPAIGLIVHFNHNTHGVTAAMITKVIPFEPKEAVASDEVAEGDEILELVEDPLEVELCLFMSTGISFIQARYKDEPTTNYWNWPPRV